MPLGEDSGSGFLSAFLEMIRVVPSEMQSYLEDIRNLDVEYDKLSNECIETEKKLAAVRQDNFASGILLPVCRFQFVVPCDGWPIL